MEDRNKFMDFLLTARFYSVYGLFLVRLYMKNGKICKHIQVNEWSKPQRAQKISTTLRLFNVRIIGAKKGQQQRAGQEGGRLWLKTWTDKTVLVHFGALNVLCMSKSRKQNYVGYHFEESNAKFSILLRNS